MGQTAGYALTPANLTAVEPEVEVLGQVAQLSPSSPSDVRLDNSEPVPPPTLPLEPVAPDETPVLPTPETPPPQDLPTDASTQIPVQAIEVIGSTIFSEADLAPVVAPYEGRLVTLEELRQAADNITQLYLERGYLTSRAVLVDQVVTTGVIQIRVIEGSLEQIDIEGTQRLNPDYVRSRVALGASTPLNQADLEDQLRLLRLDPLFENVEASLRAGSGLGQSILTVRVTEAFPVFGRLSIDNFSPPSVGSERLGLQAGLRNVSGLGDTLVGSYYLSTTGGSNVFDFSYRVPLNPMEGTLQVRFAPSDYRITDPEFADLDITGNTETYEVSFRQPLVRSPREEFALSLAFSHRDGESLLLNILADESSTSVIRFGQDWVRRDVQGAWGVRSQLSFGTDLLDATTEGSPDALFFSWLLQGQRVQILNDDNLLILQADLQLTPDPLLESEQFVIGGGQSLRGFRQNSLLGDNGFRLSIENRWSLQRNEAGAPIMQLAPFIDLGAVWNDSSNPTEIDQNFLAGIGVGWLWEPFPNFNLRVDLALPLVDLDNGGENAQDRGLYFSVGYQF